MPGFTRVLQVNFLSGICSRLCSKCQKSLQQKTFIHVNRDTICDLGGASELANYGEYSGAPSESQTYEYAKTLLSLMTSCKKHPDGKVLIIGGGIANFTNVAATFKVFDF